MIDADEPRNAPARHVHNYLTSEGVAQGDLLGTGRAEVSLYGGQVLNAKVVAARHLADAEPKAPNQPGGQRFSVELADGRSVQARRVLIAAGLVDELPDVPGVAQRWGRDVLHCPYCHGWEVRDQAIGILGTGPMAVHSARLWQRHPRKRIRL